MHDPITSPTASGEEFESFRSFAVFCLLRGRMDGEMDVESEVVEGFLRPEVDVNYEFDAPRYFDLGREESISEAQQAELWFETARSYPPSPFIVKMNFGNKKQEIVDAILIFRDVDPFKAQMGVYACSGSFLLCGSFTDGAYDTFTQQDLPVDDKHANFKGTDSSNPSFMKPTAIQLARQNLWQRSKTSSWFQKPLSAQSRKSSEDPLHSLLHADKRKKITGGLISKVVGMTLQNDLLHKNPNKECSANCDSRLSSMRLTIPREPMLETARRAKNFRAQRSNHSEGREGSTSIFKAHPLNRKILEAPSLPFPKKSTPKLPEFQEFKLKTSERAIQRSLAATTSAIADNLASSSIVKGCRPCSKNSEYQPSSFSQKMLDNKKARGSIRKLKTPNHDEKKFKFSRSKRCQPPNPLSELFNKLTLSSEAHHDNGTRSGSQESIHVTTKESKENMINPVHLHKGYLSISLI